MQIHLCEEPGDILVFLTGEEEIEDVCRCVAPLSRQEGGWESCLGAAEKTGSRDTHRRSFTRPSFKAFPHSLPLVSL
jgi:HrpA-like RNA helicase